MPILPTPRFGAQAVGFEAAFKSTDRRNVAVTYQRDQAQKNMQALLATRPVQFLLGDRYSPDVTYSIARSTENRMAETYTFTAYVTHPKHPDKHLSHRKVGTLELEDLARPNWKQLHTLQNNLLTTVMDLQSKAKTSKRKVFAQAQQRLFIPGQEADSPAATDFRKLPR